LYGIMDVMRKLAFAIVAAAGVWAESVAAEPPSDEARLACRREAAPGRVLCELEVEVARGRLAWADALVERTPEFARALRSRVGPRSATGGTARRLRLPLALAATATGQGELGVRARWVACAPLATGRELCSPRTRMLSARVEVGSDSAGR
jgi:hypothetical protein